MREPYNTEAIRQLLNQSFSAEQFDAFCYDKFRRVYDQFSAAMTKTMRIHLLIEECDRHGQFHNLLELVKAKNPHQYDTYHPQIFPEYKTTLVEFKSLDTVDFAKLSPEQKAGLALGFRITLASILNLSINEVEIVTMESGSIKITVRIPLASLHRMPRIAQHLVEMLGFIPTSSSAVTDPLQKQMISPLTSIEPKQSVLEEPDTPTPPSIDTPREIPTPIAGNQPADPFSMVLPVKSSYRWYKVMNRQDDFLPQISQGTWLLVDTDPRERYNRDDLIVLGGEELEGSISLQPHSHTLPYKSIYLSRIASKSTFVRKKTGEVTLAIGTGAYVIGVVIGIWFNPSKVFHPPEL